MTDRDNTFQVDFSHRFVNKPGDSDLINQTTTLVFMAERAIGVLNLLWDYVYDSSWDSPRAIHVMNSIDSVKAEVEDIKEFAGQMQNQEYRRQKTKTGKPE